MVERAVIAADCRVIMLAFSAAEPSFRPPCCHPGLSRRPSPRRGVPRRPWRRETTSPVPSSDSRFAIRRKNALERAYEHSERFHGLPQVESVSEALIPYGPTQPSLGRFQGSVCQKLDILNQWLGYGRSSGRLAAHQGNDRRPFLALGECDPR